VGCDAPSGFLFAVRREVWEAVGGFDEAYAPCICEDLDFALAVRTLGLECYAVAGVQHTHIPHISGARPWQRVRHNGRTEMLWRIHRRNVRHFRGKWAGLARQIQAGGTASKDPTEAGGMASKDPTEAGGTASKDQTETRSRA
jgi:GT2 family glycosyltransferase